MKYIELSRIPAFGVESKKVQAKRAGVQEAREHFKKNGKVSHQWTYKDHNIGKYIGYIPILGMLGGIVRCVNTYEDFKATRKDPTRKRLYKAKAQYLRAAIEISNLGLIILLPIDIGVSKSRKLKLVMIKRFGYQEKASKMPRENEAVLSVLKNPDKKLILRHKKVFACDKDKISKFDLAKEHLGFGRSSFKKVVDHINKHQDIYFPNPDSKTTQSDHEAFNQYIDSYNAKHIFWKKTSLLDSLKSQVALADRMELPEFPQEALNHIISHAPYEADLAAWSQVSKSCKKQAAIERLADFEQGSKFGYYIWKSRLDSYLGGVPRIPKKMKKNLEEGSLIWPGKMKKETFFPLLIPESVNGTPFDFLNIKKLIDCTFSFFSPSNAIWNHLKNQQVSSSRWVLFSHPIQNADVLSEEHPIATAFEASLFLLVLQGLKQKKAIPQYFIKTQDLVDGKPIIVGYSTNSLGKAIFHMTTTQDPDWPIGVHVCIKL